MSIKVHNIGVVGAGSWGTAIAAHLAKKGFPVFLWVYEKEVLNTIIEKGENSLFLPGIRLPGSLNVSCDLGEVVSGKDMVVFVTPSHVLRETATSAKPFIDANAIVVSASKGIENKSHLTMSGVLAEVLGPGLEKRIAVLSGPSFAKEVAVGVPTAVVAASPDDTLAKVVQEIFASPYFRVYSNPDMIGVELGGAVKNVIAIASGIVDGLGMGLNTRAALITRGLTEIRRLGIAMGANPHTFAGLAGIGDLILTCTGALSRNYTVGMKIGSGERLSEILSDMRMVAEGVKTARSVRNLAHKKGVEMPISNAVYSVLYEDLDPKNAVFALMTRDLKSELEDVL